MENKSEMIRQQMNETRTDLTDKIEMLEHRVVDTAGAACTVVTDTVGTVKEIVHDSLETVKDSVRETVKAVMGTFDFQRHVERRPWTTLAGSTALGYLGGYLLCNSNRREAGTGGISQSLAKGINAPAVVSYDGEAESHDAATNDLTHQSKPAAPSTSEEPSWLSRLGATFHDEISELKGLAVGTMFNIVRDVVIEKVPPSMERQVEELINNMTIKLGGQPIVGRGRNESIGGVQPPEFMAARVHARSGYPSNRSPYQGAMARANGRGIE